MFRIALVFSGLLLSAPAMATVITGPIINPANGHKYYLLEQASWTTSQAEAVSLGGHLVTINDAAENEWILDTFGSYDGTDRNLWIGLNDADIEGNFVWASGETSAYTNWVLGEPNNQYIDLSPESYVHLWRPGSNPGRDPGKWNDIVDTPFLDASADPNLSPFHGVVEVVPEPTSIILATLAYITIHRRRMTAS